LDYAVDLVEVCMKIETVITKEGKIYPKFQAEGNASQFSIPYAKHVCKGEGVDIGCGANKDWWFPNATPIDIDLEDEYHAMNLPNIDYDYIYSSHCLEHLTMWHDAVEYWTTCLKSYGVLFLYLPDYSQTYWRPWNNRKHKSIIRKDEIKDLLTHLNYFNIFISETDLNNSFMIMGNKNLS